MHPAVRSLFLTSVCAAASAAFADDWPNWRGPRHDGIAHETGLFTSWPVQGPKVLWQADLTGGYSSVAVAGGRLFTQAKIKAEETVLCFDALRGKKLWEFRYPCDYEDYKAHLDQRFKSGPRANIEKSRWQALKGRCWSAPVLANGMLYLRHETKLVAVQAGELTARNQLTTSPEP